MSQTSVKESLTSVKKWQTSEKSSKLVKKMSQTNVKKWQISVKKTQTCEKSDKLMKKVRKKLQTSEIKTQNSKFKLQNVIN